VKDDIARLDTPEEIAGRQLRLLREGRGWSQQKVADQMKAFGYNWLQSTIGKIEAAQRPLRLNEVADLAAMFGVPVTQFLEGDDPQDAATLGAEVGSLIAERDELEMRLGQAAAMRDASAREAAAIAADLARIEGRIGGLTRYRPVPDEDDG
jgi:transcriptional regulator with XRE-family HTH domain